MHRNIIQTIMTTPDSSLDIWLQYDALERIFDTLEAPNDFLTGVNRMLESVGEAEA
jgi:hypothetical protein